MGDPVRRHQLGTRLGLAFALTAVAAVAIATGLAWVTTGSGLDRLVTDQRDEVSRDVVAALAAAHEAAGGWDGADLLPAHTLAASAGAVLVVTTPTGVLPEPPEVDELRRQQRQQGSSPAPAPTSEGQDDVTSPDDDPDDDAVNPQGERPHETQSPQAPRRSPAASPRPRLRGASFTTAVPAATPADTPVEVEEERSLPVVVEQDVVGTATLLFVRQDNPDPIAALRAALGRNLVLAGVVAVAVGLLIAAWVTPHLTRPLRRTTRVVDRIAQGELTARAELGEAAGEIGVLARSVDRMARDLERQDRLRRALVADIAHEVRTPLAVLLGEVEALQDGVVPADAERLESLHEEVLRLARLVEDLDAIAAAEAAAMRLRRQPVDLAEVVRSALDGLASGTDLDLDLEHVIVAGDPRRLEQIVRNLLTNARKFAPVEGRITVRVHVVDGDAVLEVVDDGPGIPAGDLPHVFERFWRGTQARGTQGSGVGLAVVAELVAAHDGRVEADNAPGRGARFKVCIPRHTAGDATGEPGT